MAMSGGAGRGRKGRWAVPVLAAPFLAMIPACTPAATQADPGQDCAPMSRQAVIVEVVVGAGDTVAAVRDRVLDAVFGSGGYSVSGSASCDGPVLRRTFSSVPVFSMLASEADIQRLREHPDVRAVTADETSAPTGGRASGNNPR